LAFAPIQVVSCSATEIRLDGRHDRGGLIECVAHVGLVGEQRVVLRLVSEPSQIVIPLELLVDSVVIGGDSGVATAASVGAVALPDRGSVCA